MSLQTSTHIYTEELTTKRRVLLLELVAFEDLEAVAGDATDAAGAVRVTIDVEKCIFIYNYMHKLISN